MTAPDDRPGAEWQQLRGRYAVWVNPSSPRLRSLAPSDEVSFVPMEAVGELGGLDLERTVELAEARGGYTEFQDGDVVLAKITPCFENGKGALAESLVSGAALGTTELHVLRAKPGVDPRFIFYVTLGRPFRSEGEGSMYGAGGQKRVPPEFIKNFLLSVPPLDEQRAIAAFLDERTARIDALIEKKRALIEKLREKRAALISRTVTRGLPPDAARAAGLDPNPAMKDSGVEWLGEVPAGWEVKRLKWSIASATNGIWGEDPDGENDIKCVRVADFERHRLRVTDDPPTLRAVPSAQRQSKRLLAGDLLLEKSGGGDTQLVGAVVLFGGEFDAVCSNFIARLRLARGMDPRFWAYSHASLYAGRVQLPSIKQSTGIQNLDQERYLAELVAYPPALEQREISDFLDRATASLDELTNRVEAAILRLRKYRAALITAAVTGKTNLSSARHGDDAV